MEVVSKSYIAIDADICSGKPHIVGRRITVPQIAVWHEVMGKSVDEIATEYDLTLSEVYAGLVYYFDHREEMDGVIGESENFVSTLIQNIPSKIKLRNSAVKSVFKIKSSSPSFFESLVVELLVKMGYSGSIKDAGRSIGRSGYEGIDGIIKEDKLGLDVIYIQAKRWENVVGRPEIQKFVGALAGQGAKKVFSLRLHGIQMKHATINHVMRLK